MSFLHESAKKAPSTEFRQLKNSETDGVTYRKSDGKIQSYHVYSDVMDKWFEIPLELVQKTFPQRLISAQAEIDEIHSLESAFETRADFEIDQNLDDKAV